MKALRYRHTCFIHSAIALCAWLMPGVCSALEAAAGHLEKSAADSDDIGYQFHELLFRARLRLPENETVLRRVTQTNSDFR